MMMVMMKIHCTNCDDDDDEEIVPIYCTNFDNDDDLYYQRVESQP